MLRWVTLPEIIETIQSCSRVNAPDVAPGTRPDYLRSIGVRPNRAIQGDHLIRWRGSGRLRLDRGSDDDASDQDCRVKQMSHVGRATVVKLYITPKDQPDKRAWR